MGGFPGRISRADLGPTYRNLFQVENPEYEPSADLFNLICWQVAGASKTAPKVVAVGSVSGGVVTTEQCMFAFDPEGEQSPISFTYAAKGQYGFNLLSQYPDESETDVPLGLVGGTVAPQNTYNSSGAHSGANGASVLSVSAATWTASELVGKIVHNLTDGSFGTITANTTTTVTATLAGGTDNDWDTNDSFIIVDAAVSGVLHLTNSHQGILMFFGADGSRQDPSKFTLTIW